MAERLAPVVALEHPAAEELALTGGKGMHLSTMTRRGLPVPRGFVVTTAAFRRFVDAAGIRRRLADLPPEPDGGDRGALALFHAGAMPDDLRDAIAGAYLQLAATAGAEALPVAVRSSATAEDLEGASFAGQQDTYLGVRGADDVVARVVDCWASLFAGSTVAYRRHAEAEDPDVAMAVVVQELVDARAAGVLFTINPLNGDRSKIAVEAAPGLGTSVVGGAVVPDRWLVDKVTFGIVERAIAAQATAERLDVETGLVSERAVPESERELPAISDEQLLELVRLGKRLEALEGGAPQDVEWAVRDRPDGSSEVVLLQCRPETVWSRRRAEPRVAPATSVMDRIAQQLLDPESRRGAS